SGYSTPATPGNATTLPSKPWTCSAPAPPNPQTTASDACEPASSTSDTTKRSPSIHQTNPDNGTQWDPGLTAEPPIFPPVVDCGLIAQACWPPTVWLLRATEGQAAAHDHRILLIHWSWIRRV